MSRSFICGLALLGACGTDGSGTDLNATDSGGSSGSASDASGAVSSTTSSTGVDSGPEPTTADTGEPTTAADPTDGGGSSGGDDSAGIPDIPPECEGSVLADVVNQMAPGSWAQMPDNDSLASLEMSYALLYWSDSGVFDPLRRQVQWVGGPGSCCADPPTYQRITYDELSDTWSIEATPYAQSGHSYDANALDPETGDHYFALLSNQTVRRYDGQSWSDLPDLPIPAPATMGMTWFPSMDGLIYVGGTQNLALWSNDSWSVLEQPDTPWGTYNVFAEHSAVHDVVWMGGGNGANAITYTLAPDGTLTRQPDAPVSLGNGTSHQFADPATGNYIVRHIDSEQWWQFDPSSAQWSELTMDAPDFAGSAFHVPLPHCGVTMFFDHYGEQRTISLYRHG